LFYRKRLFFGFLGWPFFGIDYHARVHDLAGAIGTEDDGFQFERDCAANFAVALFDDGCG
jgi:hypothetical protein